MSLYPDPQGFEDHSDHPTAEEHTRLAGDVINIGVGPAPDAETRQKLQNVFGNSRQGQPAPKGIPANDNSKLNK